MARSSKTIGIRLPAELQERLREEAAKRDMRPTSYAAKLVAEALTRSEAPIEERLSELRSALDRLERQLPIEIRAAVGAAVINAGVGSPGVPATLWDWITSPQGDD